MKFSATDLNTALLHAARGGRRETVRQLLRQGADAATRTADGASVPLLLCRHAGRLSWRRGWKLTDLLQELAEAGADPFDEDAAGDSLLWHAVRHDSSGQLLNWLGSYAAQAGRDFPLECRNAAGNTPLIEALLCGNDNAVWRLLSNGADHRARLADRRTAAELNPNVVEWAREARELRYYRWCRQQRSTDAETQMLHSLSAVRRLSEQEFSPEHRADFVARSLAEAAYFTTPARWLALLQQLHADCVHARTTHGASVLHLFMAQVIRPRQAERSRTPQQQAAALRFLLQAGADRHARDRRGRTPLQRALAAGRVDLVRQMQG